MKHYFSIFLCLLVLLLAGCGGEEATPATTPTTESLPCFQGVAYAKDIQTLTADTLTEADIAALADFPDLETLDASACTDQAMLLKVKETYPHLEILCKVKLGAATVNSGITVSKVGALSAKELEAALPLLPQLKRITILQPVEDAHAMLALGQANPGLTLDFHFTLEGVTIHSLADVVDFSNIQISDLDVLEATVTKMPNLTTVEMHHCGIENEVMDALNRRYENIDFIWSVYVARMYLRTDREAFIPIKHGKVVYDYDLENLKYCTKMRAIDLGHQLVSKCDWAAYMPDLEFFLCADTMLASIEPLTGLQKLKYVEIFITQVKDYAPLLTLPALEDLNICWTYGDAEIIAQMPYLKRLWWAGKWFRPEERELVVSSLPDTLLNLDDGESTGAGWRQHDNYYEMRDLLGMHYMG